MYSNVFPNLITDTDTSQPQSVQLGQVREDPSNGKKYQLLLTNSGLSQSPIAGTVMESINAANPYIVRPAYASGGTGSFNFPKAVAQGSIGSATYFWGQILGYTSGIQTVSGVAMSAGASFIASTNSGGVTGIASGTAPPNKPVAVTEVAQGSGAILFSGFLLIGP